MRRREEILDFKYRDFEKSALSSTKLPKLDFAIFQDFA